ncbi:LuxR C-terminal-related transcriptional regulator [Sphingomonas edaphi]|uniref:LuxR C-terminal-related transcriptional regulator n=1 Tax=Sphingomonas edaphi TaxID=2315689 RepID=UPI0018F4C043|nr:LuxR C-terminal-related transcriptional regulator [Sphingomonas edaphi]
MIQAGGDDALIDSIGLSPIASVISNPRRPDNPIEVANPAFCDLTGYSEADVVGRNCRFLAGAGTEPWLTERIRQGIANRRPVLVDILNYRSDGVPFRNAVLVTPLFDGEGELSYFLGSQVELGEEESGLFVSRHQRAVAMVKALPVRQRQVLEQIARGYRNKQIAYALSISEKTVKMHRELLLQRLGASTTADAIRIAVEAGL